MFVIRCATSAGILYDVALVDDGGWQVTNLHSSCAPHDDVALGNPFKVMPLRRHTWTNARSRDGDVRIAGVIRHLENETVFLGREFLRRVCATDFGLHKKE